MASPGSCGCMPAQSLSGDSCRDRHCSFNVPQSLCLTDNGINLFIFSSCKATTETIEFYLYIKK